MTLHEKSKIFLSDQGCQKVPADDHTVVYTFTCASDWLERKLGHGNLRKNQIPNNVKITM